MLVMKKLNPMFAASAAALSLIGLAQGCADRAIDIGDDTPPRVIGASLSDYEGVWEGYTEAFSFEDASDKIRIMLDGSGNGVLEVGDSGELPPPVAGENYPPSEDDWGGPSRYSSTLVPGFSYPLFDASLTTENDQSRIQLKTQRSKLFEEWCSLFTPVLDETNSNVNGNGEVWSCVRTARFTADGLGNSFYADAPRTPVSCNPFDCMFACRCTEASCGLAEEVHELVLGGKLEEGGEVLEGTLLEAGQ